MGFLAHEENFQDIAQTPGTGTGILETSNETFASLLLPPCPHRTSHALQAPVGDGVAINPV